MLSKALVLTDGEADLLSRVLEEVKAKSYEESETSLDDAQALDAIVSCFRLWKRRKKKHVTHILAPCVSGLSCWARFSTGNASNERPLILQKNKGFTNRK